MRPAAPRCRWRWIASAAGAAAALLCLGPGFAAGGEEAQTSLADIADEVMCTVCGVPLDHAPDAPQAEAQREFIRELIDAGRSKEEVKQALVAEYGENVLAVPGTEGFDLAAWLVPALALAAATIGIALALRRWRRDRPEPPRVTPSEDGEIEAGERLEADLARYDP